jgi:Na+/melibiose symporter-like transporter
MVFSGLTRGRWPLVAVLTAGMLLVTVSRPTLGVALRQIYPDRWRGKLLSLPNTAAMLARMACLIAVGYLLRADISLYRVVFPAAGVCLLLGGFLFRGIKGSRGDHSASGHPPPSAGSQVRQSLRATLSNRTLLAFLIGYFITTCGGVAFSNVLPIFARDELALTTQQWGLARAANMGAMLVSFYFWGAFMDRFGAPLTVLISWLLVGGMFTAMFFVGSWPLFLALMAAGGLFGAGNLIAFFPVVMHFTESSETIRGMGLHFTLWGIRWVLMVSVVIAVVDARLFAMRYVFVLSALLVGLGAAVMAAVWRRDRAAA